MYISTDLLKKGEEPATFKSISESLDDKKCYSSIYNYTQYNQIAKVAGYAGCFKNTTWHNRELFED